MHNNIGDRLLVTKIHYYNQLSYTKAIFTVTDHQATTRNEGGKIKLMFWKIAFRKKKSK